MGTIYTTGYVLCPQNCGQAVEVENTRIIDMKCLFKRIGKGVERISRDQAINKVIARLKNVVVQYESRIFANRDGCGFTEHSHIQ